MADEKPEDKQPTVEELQAKITESETKATQAIAARDKISEDYKTQKSEADKLKDFTAKTKHVLEDRGIAKFDDNYNMTLVEKQEALDLTGDLDKELQELEVKMEALNEKNDSGDLDPDKFAKEHAKLVRQESKATVKRNAIVTKAELKAEFTAQQKKDEDARLQLNAQATTAKSQAEIQDLFSNKLAREFPDHNDLNSPIMKEANAIMLANPDEFPKGCGESYNNDMQKRHGLLTRAYQNMVITGKVSVEEYKNRQATTNAGFSTLPSSPYNTDDEPKKNTFFDNAMATNHIKTDTKITNHFKENTLDDLKDRFSNYEQNGVLEIEA